MSQSLVKNYIHVVFSTKHRQPLILPAFEEELYRYLGGVCKNLECVPIVVGGHADHVHILCLLSKNISLAHLIKELKASSSKWFKSKDDMLHNFYWQNGYGVFSVDAARVDTVNSYISNQKRHHESKSFQEEYRTLLTQHHVEYDERFVWD